MAEETRLPTNFPLFYFFIKLRRPAQEPNTAGVSPAVWGGIMSLRDRKRDALRHILTHAFDDVLEDEEEEEYEES